MDANLDGISDSGVRDALKRRRDDLKVRLHPLLRPLLSQRAPLKSEVRFEHLAFLPNFHDVRAWCENPGVHFVSTWSLDQYTMDEVTNVP